MVGILKLLSFVPILMLSPIDPDYREQMPDAVEFCSENLEDGLIVEKLDHGRHLIMPCDVWLDPDKLDWYLWECEHISHKCIEQEV